MAPKEPNTAWVGEGPTVFSFQEYKSQFVHSNLTYTQQQRLKREEHVKLSRMRLARKYGPGREPAATFHPYPNFQRRANETLTHYIA